MSKGVDCTLICLTLIARSLSLACKRALEPSPSASFEDLAERGLCGPPVRACPPFWLGMAAGLAGDSPMRAVSTLGTHVASFECCFAAGGGVQRPFLRRAAANAPPQGSPICSASQEHSGLKAEPEQLKHRHCG